MKNGKELYSVMIRGVRYFIYASLSKEGVAGLKGHCDSLSQAVYAYSRQEELDMILSYIHMEWDAEAIEIPVVKSFVVE